MIVGLLVAGFDEPTTERDWRNALSRKNGIHFMQTFLGAKVNSIRRLSDLKICKRSVLEAELEKRRPGASSALDSSYVSPKQDESP